MPNPRSAFCVRFEVLGTGQSPRTASVTSSRQSRRPSTRIWRNPRINRTGMIVHRDPFGKNLRAAQRPTCGTARRWRSAGLFAGRRGRPPSRASSASPPQHGQRMKIGAGLGRSSGGAAARFENGVTPAFPRERKRASRNDRPFPWARPARSGRLPCSSD